MRSAASCCQWPWFTRTALVNSWALLLLAPALASCTTRADESSESSAQGRTPRRVAAAASADRGNAGVLDAAENSTRRCERGGACHAADSDADARATLRPPTTRLWAGARGRLLANANATLLHAHPDIFVVKSLLSRDESDELSALLEQRIAATAPEPRVCYTSSVDTLAREHRSRLGLGEGAGWTAKDNDEDPQVCSSGSVGARSLERFTETFANDVMSQAAIFWEGDEVLVDRIAQRLATRYGLPRESKAHVQIIRYGANQAYAAHADCSIGDNARRRSRHSTSRMRGQDVRVATVLVYLDEAVEGGGATRFTNLGLSVPPQKGKAVLFSYIDEEGACQHKLSEHESVELQPGQVKRVLQIFYYANGFSTGFNTLLEDEVVCDVHLSGEGSCRHYLNSKNLQEAKRMVQQAAERWNVQSAEVSDKMLLAAARMAPYSEHVAINAAQVLMERPPGPYGRTPEAVRLVLLKGWRGNAWNSEINRLLRGIRARYGPDPDSVEQARGIAAPLASKLRKHGVASLADLLLMTADDLRGMPLNIGERNRVMKWNATRSQA